MAPQLSGKVALVTGAGSGIGRATAECFAATGAPVAVLDIDREGAEQTVHRIAAAGGQARAIFADVTRDDDVARAVETIESEIGAIATLVNNVGIEIVGPTHTFPLADYDRLFAVNVRSVFLASRAVAACMVPRGAGAIVNLASVASFKTWPGDGVYSATKAAVLGLTKAFAVDLAPHGIRVNAVAPAIVDTPMTDRAVATDADPVAGRERRARLHPLGRIARPQEIADAIVFLASPASAFTTGSCLTIDGGLLA